MTARDFCYWLQGYFELNGQGSNSLMADQVTLIRNHLNLVFYHDIDPSQHKKPGDKETMQAIHDGLKIGGVDKHGNIMRC